jgi:hypothetical protein
MGDIGSFMEAMMEKRKRERDLMDLDEEIREAERERQKRVEEREERGKHHRGKLVHSDTVETQSTVVSEMSDTSMDPFTIMDTVREEQEPGGGREDGGMLDATALRRIRLKLWMHKYGIR